MNCFRAIAAIAFALGGCASPSPHGDSGSAHAMASGTGDTRVIVHFPEAMRVHTLGNMRDHLATLEQINAALAAAEYDRAADLAEKRLGMTSLDAHGAAHLAAYMPEGMQQIGTRMHRAASRFGIEAQNAAVGNDPRPALRALSEVMQQCVACHAAYRLE